MKYLLTIICVVVLTTLMPAQPEDGYDYEDKIYVDYIKSVKLNIASLPLSLPVIDLETPSPLLLVFDDLGEDVSDYSYTIRHCNSDWTASSLFEMEYIDGFAEGDIETYEFGYNTFTPFTNYQLILPNRDMAFTKSGNYLLIVYNSDSEEVVLSKRFCVVEPIMQAVAEMISPAKVSKLRTHQEIDFQILHRGINIKSPQTEISATVMKNGHWESVIEGLKPVFIKSDKLVFDFQDKIVFPALNEFRNLNIRSFRSRTESIYEIEDLGSTYNIYLRYDEPRNSRPYSYIRDINGQYIIETADFNDPNLESDYGNIIFTLKTKRPYYNSDVYIVGLMNDWSLTEENRMTYNESYQAYEGDVFLKQGFYNYMYAVVDRTTGDIDYTDTEGSFFATENEYNILLYYRPIGTRYDRLVCYQRATSAR